MNRAVNDRETIARMHADAALRARIAELRMDFVRYRYTYNFTWLDRPIIQLPEDIVMMQELIWQTKPDVVVETGIAHGGGLILHASILQLLGGDRFVIGVDIDIRDHNREALEQHPLYGKLRLIEGSSTDPDIVEQVKSLCAGFARVMVLLDSNHTHEHVLAELRAYHELVGEGLYLVVMDTAIEDLPDDTFLDRPWNKTNNPKTAVWEFLEENDRFMIDRQIEDRLMFTVAPDGYLRCTKDAGSKELTGLSE